MIRNRLRLACLPVAIVAFVAAQWVVGDETEPAKLTLTDAQRATFEADPVVKKANATFESEMKAAETVYQTAQRKALEKRLGTYRDLLRTFTKAGDFDKAVVCRSAIDMLETNGTQTLRQRPKEVLKFQGHSYAHIKENTTWHVARRRCEEMGGHLVVLDNAAEFEFVARMVESGKEEVWVGGTDEETEGTWKWVTGQVISKDFLSRCQIDNHLDLHHVFAFSTGKIVIDQCGEFHRHYICEWDN